MQMNVTTLRAHAARALVRWASRSIQASYCAYVRRDSGHAPEWWDKPWPALSRRINRVALPLASRLDGDAAGAQMIEEAWWG